MTRPRTILLAAGLAAAALVMPTSARAAAPTNELAEDSTTITCTATTAEGSPVSVEVRSGVIWGSSAVAAVGPPEGPALFGAGESDWGPDTFRATVALEPPDSGGGHLSRQETPELTIAGIFAVTDEPATTRDRETYGNVKVFVTEEATALAISDVTLALDGVALAADCVGSHLAATVKITNPASTVLRSVAFLDRDCSAGDFAVSTFGTPQELELTGYVEGTPDLVADGFVPVKNGAGSGTFALGNADTGEDLGVVAGRARLSELGDRGWTLQTAIVRDRLTLTSYRLDVEIAFPDGPRSLSCEVNYLSEKGVIRAANGPQPGGVAPVNDTVAAATVLSAGDTVRQSTGGASEAEEGLECGVEVGRTVWFRVAGTGGPLTLDTAGSDFDTVIGVYASAGDSLTPVGCADDVFGAEPLGLQESLQGVATFDTKAGTAYYLQVGGTYSDFGRLVAALR